MTLVDRIQKLCEAQGTTLIGLERTLGLGRGTIRKWDTSSPSIDKLGAVADYFHTTLDYLRDGRDGNDDEEVRAIARNMKKLSTEKKKLLNELIKTMSEVADEEFNK